MISVIRAMESAVKSSVFPGAVLLVSKNADILLHRAFGVADLSSLEPVSSDTLFDLASLTKPLATTMAVLHLVQEKKLFLDKNLGDFFFGIVGPDKAGITIDDLLRHCSGLPAHRPFYEDLVKISKKERRENLRKWILNEELVYQPRANELYSDLGFILLAWVVERIAGQRLDFYVKDKIYIPLGLDTLRFREVGNPLVQGVAATENCPWRGLILKGEVHDDNAWAVGGIEGHAGLFGTAFDVWVLLKEIMDALSGKTNLIDKDILGKLIFKKSGFERVAGFDTPSGKNSSSGHFFSSNSLGHLGFTGTSFWMDPLQQVIVVLLTNRVHPSRSNQKLRKFRPFIHDLIMESVF